MTVQVVSYKPKRIARCKRDQSEDAIMQSIGRSWTSRHESGFAGSTPCLKD